MLLWQAYSSSLTVAGNTFRGQQPPVHWVPGVKRSERKSDNLALHGVEILYGALLPRPLFSELC
jgi:hypothetical protein